MSLRYYFPTRQVGIAPFTPFQVSANVFWIAPETIIPTSDGANISTWYDQSGFGYNLSKPLANSPAIASLNSYPVASYDGVNDSYVLPIPVQQIFANATSSAFLVINPVATGNDQRLISIREGGSTRWGIAINPSNQINGYTVTTDVPLYISRVDNAGASEIWINGNSQQTFTQNTFNPTEGYIGSYADNGGFLCASDIAEIIIYNKALTTAERQAVEGYLASKYNI